MIKNIIVKAIDMLSAVIAFFLNSKMLKLKDRLVDTIFSLVVKKSFAKSGRAFSIQYPADIIGEKYIHIGDNFSSFRRLRLEAYDKHLGNEYTPSIIIGDNVSINFDCHIGCVNSIVIGNNVLFASKIFITDHMHGEINAEALKTPPSLRKVISKGPVIIEDNVWIGESVAIMPNVTIGRNAIIGANSVVTASIPPNAVAAGIPARVIRIMESTSL